VNYQYWGVKPGQNVCRLGSVQNVEDDFQLLRGITRLTNWPETASYFMDKERKTHIRLEDCLWNVGSLLVVSEKVKNLLETEKLQNNEFLAVNIINHKDRLVKERYFILNQIGLQDCIDLERSEYKENRINPEYFSIVKRLVIDERRIDPDVRLFRMKKYPKIPIVYRSLAQKLIDAGITGAKFGEVDQYAT
jgi:hypothetical protein